MNDSRVERLTDDLEKAYGEGAAMHRYAQAMQAAIDDLLNECHHNPDGSWMIRSKSGYIYCPPELSAALNRALVARISIATDTGE